MNKVAKLGQRFLMGISVLEGLLFLLISYLSISFDRAFHAGWIPHNVLQNAVFLITAVIFFVVAYSVFKRRAWARYISTFLNLGMILWIFTEAFSERPPSWAELVWAVPPIVALGLLMVIWTKREIWRVEELA
jgi:uncharacterized membrane protein